MADIKEPAGAAGGTLILRLALGGLFLCHGIMRLVPEFAAKAAKGGESLLGTDVLGTQAALVVTGSGEIFVGALLVIGLFTRIALLPVIAYTLAVLVHLSRKDFPLRPEGSVPEEYLMVLGIALALLAFGPGRYSLDRLFKGL
jgi:putative oxidoreductase